LDLVLFFCDFDFKISISVFFEVGYLTALCILRLYNVDDRVINECGAVDGMRIGKVNQSTWGKPAPVPLCLPQIPHDLT
jgi:hypothetical protein